MDRAHPGAIRNRINNSSLYEDELDPAVSGFQDNVVNEKSRAVKKKGVATDNFEDEDGARSDELENDHEVGDDVSDSDHRYPVHKHQKDMSQYKWEVGTVYASREEFKDTGNAYAVQTAKAITFRKCDLQMVRAVSGVTDPFSASPLRSVRSLLRRRRSPFILLHRYSGSLPPAPLLASLPASLASPATSPSSWSVSWIHNLLHTICSTKCLCLLTLPVGSNAIFHCSIHESTHEEALIESSNAMNSIALGSIPTKHVLCATLSSCAKTLNWPLGIQIHAHIIRSGYENSLFLGSALIDFYAKCDSILEAKKVFTSMKVHDKVSWTSLISGFSINGQGKDAFLLFKDMLGTQIKPNSFTFASVIGSCVGQNGGLEKCSILHAHVVKRGFCAMNFVLCSLVDCYAKWECVDAAALVFDESTERDSIVYNSMISGYCQNLYYDDALKLFVEMRQRNLDVTDHTLCSVLNACSGIAILLQGRQVHSVVVKMGSEQNVFVVSALIDMYSKGGDIGEARAVLDQTSNKNSVLWTSMITAYACCGRGLEALELFDHLLVEKEFIPDHVCFTAILTACNHAGFLHKGVEYFNKMSTDYQLSPDIDQYACLIDLYARNGNLRRARELMVEMPYDPNNVIWSSFLNSCKIHGDVELGREAADQLIKMEPYSPPTVMVDCLGPWMSCWGAPGLCWMHFRVGLIQNKFYATKGTEAEPRKKGAAATA
ncbi:hypothetical protein AAHE18_13G136600 [Arachis hypogaea]